MKTKGWYIKEHEKLWQRIYKYYKEYFKTNIGLYNIPLIDDVKKELIKNKARNNCYLCEFAYPTNNYNPSGMAKSKCFELCPAKKQKSIKDSCLGGLYDLLMNAIEVSKVEETLRLILEIKNVCKKKESK